MFAWVHPISQEEASSCVSFLCGCGVGLGTVEKSLLEHEQVFISWPSGAFVDQQIKISSFLPGNKMPKMFALALPKII
jgi:hypothetical protein